MISRTFDRRAVASRDKSRGHRAFGAVWATQAGADVVAFLGISEKLGRALDLHAEVLQAFDQQPFVLVLREDVQEAIGREIGDDLFERNARDLCAADPQPNPGHGIALARDSVREIELLIEFERAGVHSQRARCCPGLGRLVDDADRDALFCQPKGENQSGRACADNQYARDPPWSLLRKRPQA